MDDKNGTIADFDGRDNVKPKRYRRRYGSAEPAAGDISELLNMQIKALKSGGGTVKYADDSAGFEAFYQKSVSFLEYVQEYNSNAELTGTAVIVPSVEAWACFLCISRSTILNYEKRGGSWKAFIDTFRNSLQAVKLQLASRGKMPPLIYIFDTVNNGKGYANTSEFKLSTGDAEEEQQTRVPDMKQLMQRYGFGSLGAEDTAIYNPEDKTGSRTDEQQDIPD